MTDEPEWHWSPKTMLKFLAQSIDDIPDGSSGPEAAEAVAAFMQDRGFAIVPITPTQDMHVGAEDITTTPCFAMLSLSKCEFASDVPTPSALACNVWSRMIREFALTGQSQEIPQPKWVTDFEKRLLSDDGPGGKQPSEH